MMYFCGSATVNSSSLIPPYLKKEPREQQTPPPNVYIKNKQAQTRFIMNIERFPLIKMRQFHRTKAVENLIQFYNIITRSWQAPFISLHMINPALI